jgi:hypothetical protein
MLLEFQGVYHDWSVRNQTKRQYEKQKEHDKRKKEYALKNNYKILEIWYYEFNKIEEILLKELNIKKEVK